MPARQPDERLTWSIVNGRCILSGLILGLLTPAAVLADGELTDLGDLASLANALSGDGSVVTGQNNDHAFRWTKDGGMVDLGTLGGDKSEGRALSADGSVVVGWALTSDGKKHAFRWTEDGDKHVLSWKTSMVDLGTLGGDYSCANATSADGSVVTGYSLTDDKIHDFSWTEDGDKHAFRWTQDGGMVDLGTLGGDESEGNAISADGSVVTGWALTRHGEKHAFRWTQDGDKHVFSWRKSRGMVDLGTLGGDESEGNAISADGDVIAGYSFTSDDKKHAFRWTEGGGMVDLGTLGGGESNAHAISADGNVVVGVSSDDKGDERAFRWIQDSGMQTVEDWLRANGVSVSKDLTTKEALGLSADGNVVVGRLENGHTFIARVSSESSTPQRSDGSGLITTDDLPQSLVDTGHGLDNVLSSVGLQIGGAHGRPLLRQVAPGHKTFWLAGDWGRDDHGARDGKAGLAEIGMGRYLGRVQINAALGLTRSRQSLSLGGKADADGRYLMVEALMPVRAGLVATVGAFYHRGKADLERAYLNAGLPDVSSAKPDIRTWSLRGRLDWVDLLSWKGTRVTPFADVLYSRGHMDTYTETGGGFPARFDARNEKSTELRLGLDGERSLDNGLTLLGGLEADHRFQGQGAASSGDVIGLSSFHLPGERHRKTWLRGGVGMRGTLGQGTGSLMVNVTTHSSKPTWWLAANWQRNF